MAQYFTGDLIAAYEFNRERILDLAEKLESGLGLDLTGSQRSAIEQDLDEVDYVVDELRAALLEDLSETAGPWRLTIRDGLRLRLGVQALFEEARTGRYEALGDRLDNVIAGRSQISDQRMIDRIEYWARLASALHVLAEQSKSNDQAADRGIHGDVELSIAHLTVVSMFDDATSLNDAFSDAEQLIQALSQLAQDEDCSGEVSDRATQHVVDGRALLLGSNGEPRVLPPSPRTLYGWVIDAVALLGAVDEPTGAAKEFLDSAVGTPLDEPRGLQEALQQVARSGARRRAHKGMLEGIERGTAKLFERVIAKPERTLANAVTLGAAVYDTLHGWPWLGAAVRTLVRLVREVSA